MFRRYSGVMWWLEVEWMTFKQLPLLKEFARAMIWCCAAALAWRLFGA